MLGILRSTAGWGFTLRESFFSGLFFFLSFFLSFFSFFPFFFSFLFFFSFFLFFFFLFFLFFFFLFFSLFLFFFLRNFRGGLSPRSPPLWPRLILCTLCYFHNKHSFSQNGFVSALPYIAFWIVINVGGNLADFVRERKLLSTVATRKIFNSFGRFSYSIEKKSLKVQLILLLFKQQYCILRYHLTRNVT